MTRTGPPRGRRRLLGLLGVYALFAVLFLRDFEEPRELFFWQNRTWDLYLVARSLVMFAVALWMVATLLILFFSESRLLRYATVLLVVVTMSLHLGYKHVVNGQGFTLHDAGIMVSAFVAAGDAVATYGRAFFWILLGNAVVWPVLSRFATPRIGTFPARWALLLLPTAMVGEFFVWHAAGQHCFFPIPYRVPALFSAHTLFGYYGPREPVRLAPASTEGVPNLVLIVDESVLGDHLSINGYPRETTPFLQSRSAELANLGLASAAGNASFSSVATLLAGVRMDQIGHPGADYRRFPSLPQYSTAAGFRSYIVLGQHYQGIFYNLAAACDKGRFSFVQTPGEVSGLDSDRRAADKIVECLGTDEKVFVLTQKWGAHFPYERRYPQDRKPFQPTLPDNAWTEDRLRAINSYDNAVRWAVDDYFRSLLPRLEALGKDVLVLYTSDHGQVIPGTIKGLAETQAFTENYSASACVPLFVWGTGEKARAVVRELQGNRSAWNRSSHFEVFPTILRLLGYPEEAVRKEYGSTLFDPVAPDRRREYIAGLLGVGSARVQEFRLEDVGAGSR